VASNENSDSEDEDDEDDDEDETTGKQTILKATTQKPNTLKKAQTGKPILKKDQTMKDDEDSEDDEDDDSEDDEDEDDHKENNKTKQKPVQAAKNPASVVDLKRKRETTHDKTSPPAGGTKIYVANLHYFLRRDKVKEKFQQCGPIKYFKLLMDGSKSKGQCFIQFHDAESAAKAIVLDGSDFMGRNMTVRWANEPDPKAIAPVAHPANTILYVSGFSPTTTEEELKRLSHHSASSRPSSFPQIRHPVQPDDLVLSHS